MKYAIGAVFGLFVGCAAGYFIAKKKFDKELEKRIATVKETRVALQKKKDEAAEKEQELQQAEAEETAGVNVEILANEEDEDEDYGYFDSDDVESAKREFEKEIRDYMHMGDAYNITKAEYDEPYSGFGKSILMINENEDRAYDGNTGEEIEDWRICIAEEDGTLDDSNADPETGKIYIRSERMAMDYEITYATHDWVE